MLFHVISTLMKILYFLRNNYLQCNVWLCTAEIILKFKFVKSLSQFEKQYLSILFACKADPNDKQKYVDMKNKGGLWKTNTDT